MQHATAIVRKPAVKPDRVIDTLVLDHAARQGLRGTLTAVGGTTLSVALEKGQALNDGDALRLEDGRLVAVQAAPEKLIQVTAENPARLLAAAWQIGSHHHPVEIAADALFVAADGHLAEVIRAQGCVASPITRPFRPNSVVHVCDHDHHHGHDHNHGDDHHHGHDHAHHDHDHKHEQAAAGCCGGHHAHDHKHEHKAEGGCCGGHGHDHKHEHKAEGGCCGGHHAHDHKHDHAHAGGCGCGGKHGH